MHPRPTRRPSRSPSATTGPESASRRVGRAAADRSLTSETNLRNPRFFLPACESDSVSLRLEHVAVEAVDRWRSPAGLLALALLSVVGVLRRAARQDLLDAGVRWVLEGVRAVDEGLAAEVEPVAAAVLDRLSLALGLDPWLAAILWLATVGCTAVIVVLAIAAFAREARGPGALRTSDLGRKAARLTAGSIVVGLLATLGFAVFVLPGVLVLLAFAYFPVGIVVEDDSLVDSWRRSVVLARRIPGETIGIVVVGVVMTSIAAAIGVVLRLLLPGVAGAVADVVVVTAAWLWIGAFVTRTYLAGTSDGAPSTERR